MKWYRNLLTIILCVIMSIVTIFAFNDMKVSAEVPATQIVVGHSSTFGSLNYDYSFHEKWFTIADPTGIPQEPLKNYWFYTKDGVTFWAINDVDLLQAVLTAGIGIVTSEHDSLAIIQAFLASITNSKDTTNNTFIQGGLYDSSNNLLGYCLNDISGCYYHGISGTQNVSIPSQTVNNVYNFYQYNYSNVVPDYVTFKGTTYNYMRSKWGVSSGQTLERWTEFYDLSKYYPANLQIPYIYSTSENDIVRIYNLTSSYGFTSDIYNNESYYWISSSDNAWTDFFTDYKFKDGGSYLTFEDVLEKYDDMVGSEVDAIAYQNGNTIKPYYRINYIGNPDTQPTAIGSVTGANAKLATIFRIGSASNGESTCLWSVGGEITIYRNSTIYNSIHVDKDYTPSTFYSYKYYNYSTSNDNSITISTTTIDNSVTNNQTVYDNCGNVFEDNTDKSVIDNSQIINDTTNIINIYYPDPTQEPDNPDNPNNPDNPDNPDDNGILDTILAALLRFFRAIGEIIGTIIAGFLEMVDIVLESLAGVMDSISGMSDFFASLLGWIPEPVPQLIGVGFGICILCAIISFIRG